MSMSIKINVFRATVRKKKRKTINNENGVSDFFCSFVKIVWLNWNQNQTSICSFSLFYVFCFSFAFYCFTFGFFFLTLNSKVKFLAGKMCVRVLCVCVLQHNCFFFSLFTRLLLWIVKKTHHAFFLFIQFVI